MPGNIGPLEIAIVLVIVLIIFGPKRLPELGRSMGKGIREFRGTLSGDKNEDDEEKQLEASQATPPSSTPSSTTETVEGEVVTENKA